MGTFKVRMQSVSTITPGLSPVIVADKWFGFTFPLNDPITSEAGLVSVCNDGGEIRYANGVIPGALLRFSTLGSNIILDGNTSNPLEFNGLPAGFVPTSAAVRCYANSADAAFPFNLFLQKNSFLESSAHLMDFGNPSQLISFLYDFSVTPPTMLDIVTNGCGVRVAKIALDYEVRLQSTSIDILNVLFIEGTYQIQSFPFTLEVPTTPVDVGSTITITAPSGLLDVTEIDIKYADPAVPGTIKTLTILAASFVTFTDGEITFLLPAFDNSPVLYFYFGITTATFSGSVFLGTLLTIFFTDATGIYTLVPGKANDTLYINNTPPQTVAVKIPDPFAKTGFIGG